MSDTYRPPQGVRDEAARALAWIADGKAGSGFTDTGRARASQLANGDAVSADTILRMYSFFARHVGDKQGAGFEPGDDGYPSAGRVAWAAWGGDPGYSWASKIREQLRARAALLEGGNVETRDVIAIDEPETTPDLGEELLETLADVVVFYFRAHGAHWNVKGADFAEYHKLFQKIYEDVYDSIDPLAEDLRKLGIVAPFRLVDFIELSTLQDANPGQDALALARDLLNANDVIIDNLSDAFDCATYFKQQGIANFLADRLDHHQYWKWQLTASLGEEVTEPAVDMDGDDIDDVTGIYDVPVFDVMPADRSADDDVVENNIPQEMDMIEERKSAIATADKVTFETEIRTIATTDGSLRIGGYAAQFNQEATGLNFRELIAPGAFKRSLDSGQPVFLLINHDTDALPLASTQSGTMSLSEDNVGLRMEATLDPNNPRAVELASALERGDVNKMSFAFTVAPGGDSRKDGLRTLSDVNLFEVSVVTWPAYDSTDVGMRTADAESAQAEALELRRRKLALQSKFLNK